ncbi:MAG: anti-sigma factor [Pseudonocardiaceae bacterium]|nr:anti-sigma factor [Pseudonocardiaceae bacterium]
MTAQHHPDLLGAYVLDALDAQEARTVEEHVATCPQCRMEIDELRNLEAALGDVPQEALLDGPPEDADLLLQRTLRQVRAERGGQNRQRRAVAGVAAAAVALAVLGGGMVLGRGTAPSVVAGQAAPAIEHPPDAKTAAATDQGTGSRMDVWVQPAAGWVRVNATVAGIPAGQRCRLIVVSRDGTREQIGSWLVSEKAAREGTQLDGAALVAPEDVTAVEVENDAGRRFVSVPI